MAGSKSIPDLVLAWTASKRRWVVRQPANDLSGNFRPHILRMITRQHLKVVTATASRSSLTWCAEVSAEGEPGLDL